MDHGLCGLGGWISMTKGDRGCGMDWPEECETAGRYESIICLLFICMYREFRG